MATLAELFSDQRWMIGGSTGLLGTGGSAPAIPPGAVDVGWTQVVAPASVSGTPVPWLVVLAVICYGSSSGDLSVSVSGGGELVGLTDPIVVPLTNGIDRRRVALVIQEHGAPAVSMTFGGGYAGAGVPADLRRVIVGRAHIDSGSFASPRYVVPAGEPGVSSTVWPVYPPTPVTSTEPAGVPDGAWAVVAAAPHGFIDATWPAIDDTLPGACLAVVGGVPLVYDPGALSWAWTRRGLPLTWAHHGGAVWCRIKAGALVDAEPVGWSVGAMLDAGPGWSAGST